MAKIIKQINFDATSTGTITADGAWHHIAFVRDGNTLRNFIDGQLDGTKDITGLSVQDSSQILAIGAIGLYPTNRFSGWIDELRISKGIARWIANFTPPSSAYTRPANNFSGGGGLLDFLVLQEGRAR